LYGKFALFVFFNLHDVTMNFMYRVRIKLCKTLTFIEFRSRFPVDYFGNSDLINLNCKFIIHIIIYCFFYRLRTIKYNDYFNRWLKWKNNINILICPYVTRNFYHILIMHIFSRIYHTHNFLWFFLLPTNGKHENY